MQQAEFNKGFLEFLRLCPTPFHVVDFLKQKLLAHNYRELDETTTWEKCAPGAYFVQRNQSSLLAFTRTATELAASGLRMIGAHTDSPCLKVKPNPLVVNNSYIQLGAEIYGGALLAPWFDRDLSLAGRISWQDATGELRSSLLDFKRPVAIIPSLAIHLNREANNSGAINKQTELIPIVMQAAAGAAQADFRAILEKQFLAEYPGVSLKRILDYELFLYDHQPPGLVGLDEEFLTGARLDNLLSCYAMIQALLCAAPAGNTLLLFSDHEEVGSVSTSGAQGSLLRDVLGRLLPQPAARCACAARSLFISADNAHGVHPNYPDKHDKNHLPLLNHGPVIKVNASQRYATSSLTGAFFRLLCERAEVPVQQFVMRNDLGCGSTIGPLIAGESGIKVVDVGAPSLAMHSLRETTGSKDGWYLYRVFKEFLELPADSGEWRGVAR